MKITQLIDFFIHPSHKEDPSAYRRWRLFVRACLLTSLFSTTYIWLSIFFEYEKGIYLMVFNVIGFLVLSLLAKTKLPFGLLTNIYVFIGGAAVVILTYFSGGVWSAIYPWIISIPVLALLVAGRLSGVVWGAIAFGVMVWFAILSLKGVELPTEYNTEIRTLWYVTILPGLLLIIMVVSLVFESTQSRALKDLEQKNKLLEVQKETIAEQSVELEKLIEEKDHFIRILAHDLKSPLSNITTISNMLEKEKDIEEQKKYIALIDKVSANAQGLINKVLQSAVLEQGNIHLQLEKLDVTEAVNEAINALNEVAKKKQILIEVKNEAKMSEVMADKTYLLQIFENLISNAVKFSEKKKRVQLIISNSDSHVQAKVMDEGPGINSDEESLLFQKFSKLSAKPTDNESSSGLGLSLVKRYAEQIGGKVWHERMSGVGATFVVEIPLA